MAVPDNRVPVCRGMNAPRSADQGGDGLAKMIDEINQGWRGLARELSQVIYRLGNGT